MSHFAVAVISDGTKTLEELLAPYQEEGADEKYLAFFDAKKGYQKKYETEKTKMIVLPDGRRVFPWDDCLYEEISKEEFNECVIKDKSSYVRTDQKDGHIVYLSRAHILDRCTTVDVPLKELYSTIEEFLEDYEGEEIDEKTGKYGRWYNPNAKWDWYEVGGRWSNMIPVRLTPDRNTYADEARIGDIDMKPDPDTYLKSARFWEVYVDGDKLKPGECQEDFEAWYRPEYYRKYYQTKENYATIQATFSARAVVTPDGQWHEKGEMGWWGMSSESGEESLAWDFSFKEKFIDTADPNWTLTIVDCHI